MSSNLSKCDQSKVIQQIRWKPIRDFFNNKKISQHKTELIKSCSELDICDYEKKLGYPIPSDLAYYLQYVSKEFLIGCNTFHFEFKDCKTSCNISLDENYATMSYDNNSNILFNCFDGMIQISDSSANYKKYIVVNGNHLGSIWNGNEDSVCKISNNLFSFLNYYKSISTF